MLFGISKEHQAALQRIAELEGHIQKLTGQLEPAQAAAVEYRQERDQIKIECNRKMAAQDTKLSQAMDELQLLRTNLKQQATRSPYIHLTKEEMLIYTDVRRIRSEASTGKVKVVNEREQHIECDLSAAELELLVAKHYEQDRE